LKVGFIGAGKVGYSLGKYFSLHAVSLSGFYSKSSDSSKDAALFTGSSFYSSADDLIKDSDIIFITVPDGKIKEVADNLPKALLNNKTICHCSGALTADEAFSNLKDSNAHFYSVHPLCAVSDKYKSYLELDKVYFFIEGDENNITFIKDFLTKANLKVNTLKAENKVKYHLAAAIISNHVIALAKMATNLFNQCGFSDDDALKALGALMLNNVKHILNDGIKDSLTGPVQRADVSTVQKHLNALDDLCDKQLYTLLSKQLLLIAREKTPSLDFSNLEALLNATNKDLK